MDTLTDNATAIDAVDDSAADVDVPSTETTVPSAASITIIHNSTRTHNDGPSTSNTNNSFSKLQPLKISDKSDIIADAYEYDNQIVEGNDDDEEDEDYILESLLPPSAAKLYAGSNNRDSDLDELLGIELKDLSFAKRGHSKNKKSSNKSGIVLGTNKKCCIRPHGNTIILHSGCHNRTGYGMIGPHYFGVVCTLSLLFGASYFFTNKAFTDVGNTTGYTCIVFTVMAFYNLMRTVSRDPGIVKAQMKRISVHDDDDDESDEEQQQQRQHDNKKYKQIMVGEEEGWRYCGVCSLYQPPRAAHCPDCNVCIQEYDHHCPWMGTCIGKKNMSSFVCFNITWLMYLLYAAFWVSVFGPMSVTRPTD
mmetsp:Transcript_440/g.613  ORF Transcript_440/g.613 Transcript_440/m.613 type:complete len:363 (-) Transcript_440:21-1109(-)